MTLTVSVSEFRNNISSYLAKVNDGNQLLIKDNKKKAMLAQVSKVYSFDKDSFEQSLRNAAGIFTAEHHPEWSTKLKVMKWVRRNRLRNQRTF